MRLITDPSENRAHHAATTGAIVPAPHGTPAPTPSGPAPATAKHEDLAELEARITAARVRVEATARARLAAAEDPAVRLAEATLTLARVERAAAIAEHELATDAVYRAACLERGEEMVARIPTRDGSIVLRCETEQESDERMRLVGAHGRAADAAATPDERARHLANVEEQARDSIRKLILSDRAHFERLAAKYQIWGVIERARQSLVDGRVIAQGKGVGA